MKTNIKKRKKWLKTQQTTPNEQPNNSDIIVGNTLVLKESEVRDNYILLGEGATVQDHTIILGKGGGGDEPTLEQFSCLVEHLGSEDMNDVTFTKSENFPTADNGFYFLAIDDWGNYYSRFNTYYRRNIIEEGKLTGFEIASYKKSDEFEPYPCFVDEQGNVLPYILIGQYAGSQKWVEGVGYITSVSTLSTMQNGKIYDQQRTLAKNMGVGYQFFDANMHSFIRDLTLVLYGGLDKQRDMIFGMKTNYTYGVARNPACCFIDGIFRYNKDYYYCDKPSKYVSTFSLDNTDYVKLSYGLVGFDNTAIKLVKEVGYDSRYPFINIASVGTSPVNFPDDETNYYGVTASDTTAWSGSTRKNQGLWLGQRQQRRPYQMQLDTWSNGDGYYRICYRPISEEETL